MVTKALVLLASVLSLAACSESGSDRAEGGDTGGPRMHTVLSNLAPERLCELLPNDAIEQALSVTVTEAEGTESGAPPILHKTCRYGVEFTLDEVETLPPTLTTRVVQTLDESVDEVLDEAFTDLLDESESVGDYERVDGLGDGAGYGNVPLDGGSLKESLLVVVFTAGDEQLQLDLEISPHTPLDQLKPLATDLLTGLEAELG